MSAKVRERISAARVLSAAVIERPEQAVPLARALLAGGLNVMETTFRNPNAAECVRRIRAEVPEMCVGAGTLLSPAQIDEALACGAEFGVSPGFNPGTVRRAIDRQLMMIPGVLTPGEIEQALELGCSWVKFFPALAAGGADFLRAIAGPYGHTGLGVIPLGGINERSMAGYLALPLVVAVGGSWLTDRELAAAGRWDEVTERTRRALAIAEGVSPGLRPKRLA